MRKSTKYAAEGNIFESIKHKSYFRNKTAGINKSEYNNCNSCNIIPPPIEPHNNEENICESDCNSDAEEIPLINYSPPLNKIYNIEDEVPNF